MRISFFVCFVLVLVGVGQSFASFTVGGYEITAGITQRGERLELDGKIKSGPKCNNLLIRCSVLSTQGQTAMILSSTDYSGSGTNLYDGKQRVRVDRSKGLPSWDIIGISVRCND